MYDVYVIKDATNTVIYVGVTKVSKGYLTRFEEHKVASKNPSGEGRTLIHSRMRAEGVENFTVTRILKNIPDDKAAFYERLWISKFNTFYKLNNNGCNMTRGGHGVVGYQYTPDVLQKISESSKALWDKIRADPERYAKECQRRSDSLKGRPKSLSHRQKISEHAKTRTGERNPFFGKHHTDKTKAMISKVTGKPVNMYDKETGIFLQSFPSALQAGQYMQSLGRTTNKTPNDLILQCCHGDVKSAYGFVWKLQESVTTMSEDSSSEFATERSAQTPVLNQE